MPDPIVVATIRHPVGADGTMRYRFTFEVSVDPSIQATDFNLGRMLMDAMTKSLRGALRDQPLHLLTSPDQEFLAGYDAVAGEDDANPNWTTEDLEARDAKRHAALVAHRARQDEQRTALLKAQRREMPPGHEHTGFCPECHGKPEPDRG